MSSGTVSQPVDIDGQVIHISIPNQPVQVQSVIQSNQPSVIQTAGPNVHTIHVTQVEEDGSEDIEGRKRREILTRRPSYRKILNELASDSPAIPGVSRIDEESNSSQSQDDGNGDNVTTVTVIPQGIQITAHPDGSSVAPGIQTLTMTNAAATGPGVAPPGTTIVQYARGPDGQLYLPGFTMGNSGVQAYQLASTAALSQGVVMATTGSPLGGPQLVGEEASRKRELRLLKNREAARECRRKKKEYVKCLENRVAVLENQNKTLIEELKALKELYCQKEG